MPLDGHQVTVVQRLHSDLERVLGGEDRCQEMDPYQDDRELGHHLRERQLGPGWDKIPSLSKEINFWLPLGYGEKAGEHIFCLKSFTDPPGQVDTFSQKELLLFVTQMDGHQSLI